MAAIKVDNSPFRALSLLADALLPPKCIVCGAPGQPRGFDLCAGCERDLPAMARACDRCGVPLPRAVPAASLCGHCLRHASPVTATRCAFHYAWPVHHLLRDLKYRHVLCHARVLGSLLARHLEQSDASRGPEVLCPVPLGPRRHAQRGFNQAIEIGRVVAGTLRIPLRTDLVVRARETAEQSGLGRHARRHNVYGAFAAPLPVQYRHIVVLDDVVTTGHTVREMARVLSQAGAGRVDVWAVARAAR